MSTKIGAARAARNTAAGSFAELRASRFPDAQHLLYIDLDQVQAAVRTHGDWLVKQELAKGKKSEERIRRDQQNLLSLLDLVDAAYWAKTIRAGGVEHVIRLVGSAK